MAVVLQIPVRVGREPVVAIAVQHDRVVVGDAPRPEERAEVLGPEEAAPHLVLEVVLPVEADGSGDVTLPVERAVLVDLDDADRRVVEMVCHPVGVDQHVLRMVRHAAGTLTARAEQRLDRSACRGEPRGDVVRVGLEQRERAPRCARWPAASRGSPRRTRRPAACRRPRRRPRAPWCRRSARASSPGAIRAARRPAPGRPSRCPAATAAASRCPARSAACRRGRGRRARARRRRRGCRGRAPPRG